MADSPEFVVVYLRPMADGCGAGADLGPCSAPTENRRDPGRLPGPGVVAGEAAAYREVVAAAPGPSPGVTEVMAVGGR